MRVRVVKEFADCSADGTDLHSQWPEDLCRKAGGFQGRGKKSQNQLNQPQFLPKKKPFRARLIFRGIFEKFSGILTLCICDLKHVVQL